MSTPTVTETDSPILARAAPIAFPAAAPLPAEFMWMPAGVHTIHASQAGKVTTVTIEVGSEAAAIAERDLRAMLAKGPRPYFDFDHDDTAASAWPTAFRWESGGTGKPAGVYVAVEWSKPGAEAVMGKAYRSFSPAFFATADEPKRIKGTPLNMGGLVNSPAFRAIAPITAKDISAAQPPPTNPTVTMSKLNENENGGAAPAAAAATTQPDAAITAKLGALETENAALKAKETTRRKADADTAVKAAVARGALAPKDEAIQAKWRGLIEADPTHAELLAALPSNAALSRVTTPGGHIEAKDGTVEVLRALSKMDTGATGERAAIYAKDIAPLFDKGGFSLGPILAANSLGTLSGELVVQRSLTLLKLSFPELRLFSTDFSAENAAFNQTVKTRLRTIPTMTAYNATTGYATSDAGATDVPVVIDQHNAVQIAFNANELASSNRDLFGEQAEGCHYSIGKGLVDTLLAVITAGNFANATTKALATFGRADMQAMAKALTGRGVPRMGRFALLNQDYHEKLSQDASIVSLATFKQAEIITEGKLPRVAGLDPYEVVNLPGTGNLTGFAGTADALALATRLPNDYTKIMPDATGGGVVQIVTNPDTGISVMLVRFVNHTLGAAFWRVALMWGAAKGNGLSGQRLISA